MQSLLCKPKKQWRAYRCITSVSFTQIKSTEMQTTKAQHAIDPHVPQLDQKSCGEQMVQAGPKIWITALDFSEVHPLHFRKERLSPVKFNTILYAGKQQNAPNKAASHSCGQISCILGCLLGRDVRNSGEHSGRWLIQSSSVLLCQSAETATLDRNLGAAWHKNGSFWIALGAKWSYDFVECCYLQVFI